MAEETNIESAGFRGPAVVRATVDGASHGIGDAHLLAPEPASRVRAARRGPGADAELLRQVRLLPRAPL
jgi:hypothetical protein